jgi:hypothetical protein
VLPLPPVVVDALRDLHRTQAAERLAAGAAYGNPDGRVVVDEIGHTTRPETYSDTFPRLVKLAGLPRIPLRGARHCAASLPADLGYPVVIVAAWLGQISVRRRLTASGRLSCPSSGPRREQTGMLATATPRRS